MNILRNKQATCRPGSRRKSKCHATWKTAQPAAPSAADRLLPQNAHT